MDPTHNAFDWFWRRPTELQSEQSRVTQPTTVVQDILQPDPEFRTRFDEYLDSRASRIASHKDKIDEWATSESNTRPAEPAAIKQGQETERKSFSSSRIAPAGAELPPRPPTRSRSVHSRLSRLSDRLSITPLDLQLPSSILEDEDKQKTARMLGIEGQDEGSWLASGSTVMLSNGATSEGVNTDTSTTNADPVNGTSAWIMVAAAFLAVFNCWGFCNTFGLYQAYYARYYIPQVSQGTIAYIGSTQLALVFGLGVPVGKAVDAGYFRWIFHVGSIVMVVAAFGTSFCTTFAQLWVVQGLLMGLGMGSVFCSGLICLMGWFDQSKIGVATAFAAAGSCAGGIVYILLSRHLLVTEGFGTTMRILAGTALATMIPPNMLFRMRVKPRRPPKRQTGRRSSLKMFLDPAYLLAGLGMFFSYLGLYFGFVYIITYASEVLGLSDTDSTNILIAMLAVNFVGRLIPAVISDKWSGPLNAMIGSVLSSAIVLIVWLLLSAQDRITAMNLTIIACVYGCVSGGIQSLYAPVTYSFCLEAPTTRDVERGESTAAIERIGFKAGAVFTFIGVACLIGTPIGGGLIRQRADGTPDFIGAQCFATASMVAAALCLVLSRTIKVGFRLRRA